MAATLTLLPAFVARLRYISRCKRLGCILLLCCSALACRRSGEAKQQSEKASPAAKPKPKASSKAAASSAAWPPPVPPRVPPQLVACGERDFYRIDQRSLHVFEVAPVIPPPHIRGSRVARQTTQVDIAEPLNVISLPKKRALVVAKNNVYVYELGRTRARRYEPIPAASPIVAWANPRKVDSFWVRAHEERSVRKYTLASLPDSGAKSTSKQPTAAHPITAGPVKELSDFDGRLFTVLTDGSPFYSTPEGLRWPADSSRLLPFPVPSKPATVLLSDPSPNRYWAADSSGALALWNQKQPESPVFSARVPGVVIDAATAGKTVVVLSMELVGESYRPTVTVFSEGEQQGQLSIAPSFASGGQPKVDLCLLAGRPWVVVGGRHWLQLLDWSSRRLLAEW